MKMTASQFAPRAILRALRGTAHRGKSSMVKVMVNPGHKLRDKINQRDAGPGDLVEVRDVERKILMHRGIVSDPPSVSDSAENDSQTALSLADETQTAPPAAPEPVAAPEASVESEPERAPVESTPESTPGAEFLEQPVDPAEVEAATLKTEIEEGVEQDAPKPRRRRTMRDTGNEDNAE